ncbi:tetratricopeptide repeat protein [bacterium]|jgi:predicted O-linked N-acetylglucosamine transferase (SPINDLY family)|nr:tetratricopeptide repeat protein [bacterium]
MGSELEKAIQEYSDGDYPAALTILEALIADNPDHNQARFIAASLYQVTEAHDQALRHYGYLLDTDTPPENTAIQYAQCLVDLQKWGEVQPLLENLVKAHPENATLYSNLGLVLLEQKQYIEAEPYFYKAMTLDEFYFVAYMGLAMCYEKQRKIFKAKACYEELLIRDPEHTAALIKFAKLSIKCGENMAGFNAFKKALEVDPTDLNKLRFDLMIPSQYKDKKDLLAWRDRFEKNLDKWHQSGAEKDALLAFGSTNFYSLYQGFNEVEIQRKTAELFETAIPEDKPLKKSNEKRIKIGVMGTFFYDQSVMHFYKNMLIQLPKEFHLTIICPGLRKRDHITKALQSRADQWIETKNDLEELRTVISDQSFDILIYPEIGMEPTPYVLAMSRLAPVQCVLMGNPVTTGIPTIDYYVGSEVFESEAAANHYTETLVQIPGFPVDYDRSETQISKSRADLGLPEENNIYMCPMTLFKIHPDFDPVIAGILRQDPNGVVILFSYFGIEKGLMDRFKRLMPDVVDRIQFINPLPNADFGNMMALVDVILETFPFGGGNTALQALSTGTPAVTMQTEFLRGRWLYGYYKYAGIDDLITEFPEDYVTKCVQVATDKEYRQRLKDQIIKCHPLWFNNREGTEALYQWFRTVSGK